MSLTQAGAVPALASWEVRTAPDPGTKEIGQQAFITNEAGHSFAVHRGVENTAWVTFSLSQASPESLDQREVLVFQVDAHDPIEEDNCAAPGVPDRREFCVDERKQISFRIWHGIEREGRSPALKQLMAGSGVEVQYRLRGGGLGQARFPLEGAGSAIAAALGIPEQPNPVIEAAVEAMRNVRNRALKVCESRGGHQMSCALHVLKCEIEADRDVNRFLECLRTKPDAKK